MTLPGSKYEKPTDSTGFQLWKTSLIWQRRITKELKPLGLSHAQFVLLASTWWLERDNKLGLTQRQISDFASTDPMMTSQIVRSLEERDLLSRKPNPNDSRANLVTITKAGRALTERAIKVVEDIDEEFFSQIPKADALLKKIAAGFDGTVED